MKRINWTRANYRRHAAAHRGANAPSNLLHIETEGCIVNIRLGLVDDQGREVTSVQVLADGPTRHHGKRPLNGWQVATGPENPKRLTRTGNSINVRVIKLEPPDEK